MINAQCSIFKGEKGTTEEDTEDHRENYLLTG